MNTEKGFWSLPTEKGYRDYSLMVKIVTPAASFIFAMIMMSVVPFPSIITFFVWWVILAGFLLLTFLLIFGIVNILSTAHTAVQSINESNIKKKHCPFCDEKISQRATICPFCRTQLLSIEK